MTNGDDIENENSQTEPTYGARSTTFNWADFLDEMATMPKRNAVGVEHGCRRVTRMVLDLLELVPPATPTSDPRETPRDPRLPGWGSASGLRHE